MFALLLFLYHRWSQQWFQDLRSVSPHPQRYFLHPLGEVHEGTRWTAVPQHHHRPPDRMLKAVHQPLRADEDPQGSGRHGQGRVQKRDMRHARHIQDGRAVCHLRHPE